ncbi:monovalent cation:proton antiporter-2 (CPA2) family protein [Thalassotalea sp. Y01]|uniref:monovalent cation:proton antiporter-2 (CPA2) family protein n=1 Tax=Thalassotalea sp. Y01 TaxID=2729613 RepID=UPI00145D6340|nr:monovalent cation:proton antiporter-2 (CPA2) family protein [Thalassotalea sp. Y01]NMP17426.1 potassium transporter [Thalassotalea sp. Y01]
MTGYFIQGFIYLVAAVIFVPLAKRLGLGSVLGYLIAGVIIGPLTGIVGQETITIQHFAEFGVVMMLFLVGLELEPKNLWQMRNKLIGLGGMQVVLTTLAVASIAYFIFSLQAQTSLAIGLLFSLSSTAIVLQTFSEKGLTKTIGGQNAFSVLLMQDIAVIPMLAFIPLLALPELVQASQSLQQAAEHHEEISLVAHLPGWAYALTILASITGVCVGGYYLSRPLFHYVAKSGLREIFVATALLLVVGIAALMSLVGLSPALGTFLAGVVLANSEFRHELESNIEPFKGLLLGLFFITVGAGINFGLLFNNIFTIVAITLTLMLLKMAILAGLAKTFKIHKSDTWLVALSLAQAGEFGFVLLSFSIQNHVLPADIASTLQLVVALSMFLTPLLFIFYDKVILPRYQQANQSEDFDDIDTSGCVVIAGAGRFGQIVNRLMISNDITTVVMDYEVAQVENIRKINVKSYFGDATRPELLHTAGLETARLFVIAIDRKEEAVELTKYVTHTYPHVKILVRAFDKGHSYELSQAGADIIVPEVFYSAVEMGAQALREMGHHPFDVEQKRNAYIHIDEHASRHLYENWLKRSEGEQYGNDFIQLFIEFEDNIIKAMKHDRMENHDVTERGWTPPPKDYQDELDKQ